MPERPILFSGPMVRAILEGRKSQTRRVVNPQPPAGTSHYMNGIEREWTRWWPCSRAKQDYTGDAVRCPFGFVGDRLWVRETTAVWPGQGLVYTADDDAAHYELKKRPAIFMPRADCRLVLEVTAVRVEPLQDINADDATAEGVDLAQQGEMTYITREHFLPDRYRVLWDSINAKRAPWASNPWVWVVEFRQCTAPPTSSAKEKP